MEHGWINASPPSVQARLLRFGSLCLRTDFPGRCSSENKNPAYVCCKQGERKLFRFFQNLLTPRLSKLPSSRCPIGPGETYNRGYTGYDVSLSRLASSA